MFRNADGVGVSDFLGGKKRYEGVMFNVISVTRGWVEVRSVQHVPHPCLKP